jgi:hypothetical protein
VTSVCQGADRCCLPGLPPTLHPNAYAWDDPVDRIDPTGHEDEEEYTGATVEIQNLKTNAAMAARKLRVPVKLFWHAIELLKRDNKCWEGNPKLLIDITNGNAYLSESLGLIGCVLNYLTEEDWAW